MVYRLIIFIFLFPCLGWGNSFPTSKIQPSTLQCFHNSLNTLHPDIQVIKADPLNGESVDLVFHVYLSNGSDYFIRFFQRKGNQLNRLKIKVTQDMSKIWQGPQFITSAKDGKSFVTEFIDGKHLGLEDFKKNPRILMEFVDKMRQSHEYLKESVAIENVPNYSMSKRSERRLDEIKDLDITLPHIEKVKKILQYVEMHTAQEYKQPVHNDVRPENIILDAFGNTYLIDWAEVTQGNVYDDLGAFAEFFRLNIFLEKKVLKRYFNKTPSSDSLALLETHRWVNGLHRAAFKFRKNLNSMKKTAPKTWGHVLNTDNKDLKKSALDLKKYLDYVDDIKFRSALEKIGFKTNISIIERGVLWLKMLVKDA